MTISKRKMESYKRAEMLCREIRHRAVSDYDFWNAMVEDAVDLLFRWMRVTGDIKYARPGHENPKPKKGLTRKVSI